MCSYAWLARYGEDVNWLVANDNTGVSMSMYFGHYYDKNSMLYDAVTIYVAM